LLPVVFGALVFKLSVWCRAVGCVSGLRDAAASCKPAFYFHISTPFCVFMNAYFDFIFLWSCPWLLIVVYARVIFYVAVP